MTPRPLLCDRTYNKQEFTKQLVKRLPRIDYMEERNGRVWVWFKPASQIQIFQRAQATL